MRRSLLAAVMILMAGSSTCSAQIDVAKLAEAYKAYDMTRSDGKGFSESADSGTLGWGEGAVIQSYAQMWEATEDPYWLAMISEHFGRIANTWLKLMWNGDEDNPRMAAGVDGREPHKFSPLHPTWSLLSQWDRKAYELALKVFLAQSPEEQAQSAPMMLLCAKRAGMGGN